MLQKQSRPSTKPLALLEKCLHFYRQACIEKLKKNNHNFDLQSHPIWSLDINIFVPIELESIDHHVEIIIQVKLVQGSETVIWTREYRKIEHELAPFVQQTKLFKDLKENYTQNQPREPKKIKMPPSKSSNHLPD